jgi:hypothetical protein
MMDLFDLLKLAKKYADLDEYARDAIEGLFVGHPVCDFDEETLDDVRKFLSSASAFAEEYKLEQVRNEADMIAADIDAEKVQ